MSDIQASIQAALGPRYEIQGEVGRGGMATVYRAFDRHLERPVALKVLHPELSLLLGSDRFHREITIAASLEHANVVSLYEAGEADGFLFFTMPLVEGETLRARLEREGQLPVTDAVRIAEQVAAALGAAHGHGVVHRDVKPENILLSGERALVADFGLARAITAAGANRLTSAGLAVGTPAYMSPEQAAGQATVDARSDIYALGCVLYEMLAGEPPFTGPTVQAVVARQLQEPPRSLRVVRPGVSPALQAVVEQALAKVPADRFTTVQEFSAALELASREPAVGALGRRLWRRRRLVVTSLVAVVALAVAARFLIGRSAFAEGKRAFDRWNLARAQQQLRRAVAADPRNGEAYLWLAQAAVLQGAEGSDWRSAAQSAWMFAPRLKTARDSGLARGLLSLADSLYPQACAVYDSAVARDSLDVLAWFGLGECRRRDNLVVRDARSATGWRFRSSYEGAVQAYQRALQIAPQLNFAFGPSAYERLVTLLVPEPIWARNGDALPPDTGLFLAYPALDHDTLLLVPHPAAALGTRPPSTSGAAVAKGRRLLRDVVGRWVEAFPASSRAHAALALALEIRGELVDTEPTRPSALGEIRRARRLETDATLAIRDAAMEIRLELKLGRFARARALADSVLGSSAGPGAASAGCLACIAALVGRAHRTAQLLAATASDSSFGTPIAKPREVPVAAAAPALRFVAYASLGAPADSLPALELQVDTALRRYVEPGQVDVVRHQIMDLAAMLAFPTRRAMPALGPIGLNFLTETELLLSRGDTASARARLDAARREQTELGPSSVLPEHAFLQSWLAVAVHDTAGAEWLLRMMLDNLAAAPTMLTGEPQQSAMLVRAMALEARLAAARHDGVRARLWAARVDTLWSGSDLPQLRSLVDSLAMP